MPRDDPQFNVRMNPDLKRWLQLHAAENKRSLNSEILLALERYRRQSEEANAAKH